MEDKIKVEFALGNQISSAYFFKSSFARSFVINCHDVKSLDTEFYDANNIDSDNVDLRTNVSADGKDNNYILLTPVNNLSSKYEDNINSMQNEQSLNDDKQQELNDLRKQCQTLMEENRRLENSLLIHQTPDVQTIDNMFLQSQIDTLQWQLKQIDANRQMYRSMMKEVVNFLGRTRMSLDILYANSNFNRNIIRNNHSQSLYINEPSKDQYSPISMDTTSEFIPIEPIIETSSTNNYSSSRNTWSKPRRSDPEHFIRSKVNVEIPSYVNNIKIKYDTTAHKRTNDYTQTDRISDHMSPDKLSQEAYRLLKRVESLLAIREPHLTIVSSNCPSFVSSSESSSSLLLSSSASSSSSFITSSSPAETIDNNNILNCSVERNLSFQHDKIMNSTTLHNNSHDENCTLNDCSTDMNNSSDLSKFSCSVHNLNDSNYTRTNVIQPFSSNLVNVNDAVSTEKQEDMKNNETMRGHIPTLTFPLNSVSQSNEKIKTLISLENKSFNLPVKSMNILNSTEDESGFSSMGSFQDIGIPMRNHIASIKSGYHTEVGLPEISLDKINHRRWSSTPAEIQALFRKYKNGFLSNQTTGDSLSVWV